MLSSITALQSSSMKFPNYDQFRASSRRQVFSIPNSIIYYMIKNPSSNELYQTMIKTCKYFFIKNPIIYFHCLQYYDKNGWETCVNKNCIGVNRKFCKIDIKKIKSRICVKVELRISSQISQNVAASLMSKLYQSNVYFLELFDQSISFDDLLFFSKELRQCILYYCTVFCENGKEVPCEEIVANLPNIYKFDIEYYHKEFHNFSNTVTELLKIPHFRKLIQFTMCGINETFDIEKFYEYLKKNKETMVFIEYNDELLSDNYKNKLQAITDEILDSEIPREYRPPYIDFEGQLRGDKLYELHS